MAQKRIENLYEGLTDQQRIFVDTYVELGGGHGSIAAAARRAGYSEKSVNSIGNQLMKNERVLSAMKKLIDRKFRAGAVVGMNTMIWLAENSANEGTRLKAAEAILDRTGFGPKSTQDLNVNVNDTRERGEILDAIKEKLEQIEELEPKIKKLEFLKEEPIDVEFSEVELDKEIEGL